MKVLSLIELKGDHNVTLVGQAAHRSVYSILDKSRWYDAGRRHLYVTIVWLVVLSDVAGNMMLGWCWSKVMLRWGRSRQSRAKQPAPLQWVATKPVAQFTYTIKMQITAPIDSLARCDASWSRLAGALAGHSLRKCSCKVHLYSSFLSLPAFWVVCSCTFLTLLCFEHYLTMFFSHILHLKQQLLQAGIVLYATQKAIFLQSKQSSCMTPRAWYSHIFHEEERVTVWYGKIPRRLSQKLNQGFFQTKVRTSSWPIWLLI